LSGKSSPVNIFVISKGSIYSQIVIARIPHLVCMDHWKRTGHDPRHGSPTRGEKVNVKADERDRRTLRIEISRCGDGARDGDDELTDGHPDGAEEEEVAAAEFLDEVEAWDCGDDVDGAVGDG
jgi:hypothetical protein